MKKLIIAFALFVSMSFMTTSCNECSNANVQNVTDSTVVIDTLVSDTLVSDTLVPDALDTIMAE